MKNSNFSPFHINATADDFLGNNGIGRYVFLPGSDGRAKQIAEQFDHFKIKQHPRGHHLYLGEITKHNQKISVASIATGMGCPSMEVILHELIHLGAKRFLRVGTAGSMQPKSVPVGSIVNAYASVRDESTTINYVPLEVPAVSSFEMISSTMHAAKNLGLTERLHTGLVHCKSSFYAREFAHGPKAQDNKDYLDLLTQFGVLATEMETATLFIQSQYYNHMLKTANQKQTVKDRIISGALLGVIAIPPDQMALPEESKDTISNLIKLALETISTLALFENQKERAILA